MKFEGKCALVTGAAGGIGGAIVRLLRAKGARGSSRRDTSGIDAEAHFPGDLTDVYYANNLPAEAAKSLTDRFVASASTLDMYIRAMCRTLCTLPAVMTSILTP